MKIALVVHDLHEHGGHSLYTRILADELSDRHHVTVFANRCERPEEARWQFRKVPAWRSGALATVQTFPLGIKALGRQLKEFDVRHMQGYCGGAPNVVTAHICVAAYLESLQSARVRNRASLRLMAAAEARFYRRYEGSVVAISEKIARELRDYYRVTAPIEIIPHGVNADGVKNAKLAAVRTATRAELGFTDEQTVALYVGDLAKAHVHLKQLAEAQPRVQFVIISRSPSYRWSQDNVRFLPPTAELFRYYAAADAFVFPTTYDAFGMVLLEAMAIGLPVFSSDQAGAAELISSGKDGFVFALEDWVEATAAMLDKDTWMAVGNEAQRTAQRHDWSTVVQKIEQVYFAATA